MRIDQVSNKLSFYGRTSRQGASESDPYWQISRTAIDGNVTRVDWANGGSWDQSWTDRASIFPPAIYSNNYSVLFDGINDSVSFGNNLTYDVGTQWSFSVWFKANNLAARRTLFAKATNDAAVTGLGIYLESATGQIFMQTRGAGGVGPAHTSTMAFAAGVWNNFTLTYSGSGNQSGYRLYFNGAVDVTPASSVLTSIANTATAYLGIRNAGFPFSGNIDEAAWWTKALSAAEVSELYNAGVAPNLLTHSAESYLDHYYRLGDGDTSPTVLDNAGSVNGTLTNGAIFTSDAP